MKQLEMQAEMMDSERQSEEERIAIRAAQDHTRTAVEPSETPDNGAPD